VRPADQRRRRHRGRGQGRRGDPVWPRDRSRLPAPRGGADGPPRPRRDRAAEHHHGTAAGEPGAGPDPRGASWASPCSPPRRGRQPRELHHRGLRRGRRRGRAARHRPAACPAARNTPAAQLPHLDHRAGRSHPGGRPVQPAGHPAEQGPHRGDQSGRGRGRDLAADRRRPRRQEARQPTPGAGSRRDARSPQDSGWPSPG
jgi:hypothetical protein